MPVFRSKQSKLTKEVFVYSLLGTATFIMKYMPVIKLVLRGLGVVFLLLALWYISYGFLVPLIAPAISTGVFFVSGTIYLFFSVLLLRGALIRELLHPSRYDLLLVAITFVLLSYVLSWIFAQSFWSFVLNLRVLVHIDASTMRTFVGAGFLMSFVTAVCFCVSHIVILVIRRLRVLCNPLLLSHISFFFLLLLSVGIGSQIASRPFPYLSSPHHP